MPESYPGAHHFRYGGIGYHEGMILCLTLKDSVNRWANIIVGLAFTILSIMEFGEEVAKGSAHGVLLYGTIVIAPALIVWYAWKWPKPGE